MKKIVFFLSTDEYPSPFDIQMIYDAGADVVVAYGNVTPEKARQLILDAMFPRGPGAGKHTKIFIGGQDVEACEKIVEVAKKTMFSPFELPVFADPRGGYTTAAALVAKVKKALREFYGLELKDSKVAILAATGPVGMNATRLIAVKEGAEVYVAAGRRAERAKTLAEEINKVLGVERVRVLGEGVVPRDQPDKLVELLKEFDVIITTGAPGIQFVPRIVLEKLEKAKIVADVNAVPPTGIEGLKPSWDGKEVVKGIRGIGALAIGSLKNRVELELFKKLLEAEKGFFGLDEAYETALQLLGLK